MLQLVKGYFWQGFNRAGKLSSGVELNLELKVIRSQLQQQGILVTQFRPVRRLVLGYQQISTSDIVQFSYQLAHLLQADFSLVTALDCLSTQYPAHLPIQSILLGLKLALENGMAFSEALRQYPSCFNNFYCYMIEVSEQCGTLGSQLIQLANYHEKLLAIKRNIFKALYYPMSLLGIACAVIILLLILVVPKFEDLFYTVGATLPTLTRLLIKSAHCLQRYGFIIGINILSISSLLLILRHKMQHWIEPFRELGLRLPWIGSVLHQAVLTRFCYTLSTTLSAGIPLLKALFMTQQIMDYSLYRTALSSVSEAIKNGSSLDQALQETRCFTPLLVQTVAIGQSSGHLETSLAKLAQLLENQVSEATNRMISVLEPMLLVVLGVIIGALMLALYWPVFELGNVVGLS